VFFNYGYLQGFYGQSMPFGADTTFLVVQQVVFFLLFALQLVAYSALIRVAVLSDTSEDAE
jgi:hypothetical protein